MKNIRKAYRGEKGFTLVELLVVVVILGILAAVAAVAIMRFMSAGNVSAANEELHQAQVAIAGAMFEGGVSDIDGASATYTWDGSTGDITCGSVDPGATIDGVFKATYTLTDNGTITSGTVLATGGWSKVQWDTVNGGWIKA